MVSCEKSVRGQIRVQVEQHLVQSDRAGHQGRGDHVGRLAAGDRVHEAGRGGDRAAGGILDAGLNQILIAVGEHRHAEPGGVDVNHLAGDRGIVRRHRRIGDGGAAEVVADGGHDDGGGGTGGGAVGDAVAFRTLDARFEQDALEHAGGGRGDFRILVDQVDQRVADAGQRCRRSARCRCSCGLRWSRWRYRRRWRCRPPRRCRWRCWRRGRPGRPKARCPAGRRFRGWRRRWSRPPEWSRSPNHRRSPNGHRR